MKTTPSTEERVWAVLSHLSALAFGMGILLPIVGWSEQRRKSKYAAFQCLQALGYQSLGYTVWLLTYLVVMLVSVGSMVAIMASTPEGASNMDVFTTIWMSVFLVMAFGSFGLYLLLPVIAAVACAFGKDFRYPIMGNRLARYLGYDSDTEQEWLIEEHEDRWVAAMGHFSVIILLWGILAPLTAWILQGKRGLFMRFQSIQTLIYQALATLLYVAGMALYTFGFFVFMALTGLGGGNALSSSTGMVGMGVLLISMLFAIGIVLLLPLFHIMGQWAGYRVLKGDDYRYPVVGRLVEKWLTKNQHHQQAD
ncbi:MAG: DUF4870 domain-containing protein [Chloroflexota bacterium]